MVDILDHFKVFEVSFHYLSSPKPMALFRGSAPVRDAGLFFNIQASLANPLGPFRSVSSILQAAHAYLELHTILPPIQRTHFHPLPQHILDLNKQYRLNSSLTSSQRNSMMIRPVSSYYPTQPPLASSLQPWNGLGISNLELATFIRGNPNPIYLFPLSGACESAILWNDSKGNRPGWMTNTYNSHTRLTPKGPIISSKLLDLFYRPDPS
jgi:hypothetical protein